MAYLVGEEGEDGEDDEDTERQFGEELHPVSILPPTNNNNNNNTSLSDSCAHKRNNT